MVVGNNTRAQRVTRQVAAACAATLGCVALLLQIAALFGVAENAVQRILRILLWLFVVSCLATLTSGPATDATNIRSLRRFKWPLSLLTILWLAYSGAIVASNIFGSQSTVLLR